MDMANEKKTRKKTESMIYSIVRMSQKALMFVLILIGAGYIGGLISIVFDNELAEPLAKYSQIFIPLFQLEIGVYGFGSTLENVQKIRGQIDAFNKDKDGEEKKETEEENENG